MLYFSAGSMAARRCRELASVHYLPGLHAIGRVLKRRRPAPQRLLDLLSLGFGAHADGVLAMSSGLPFVGF
jgi:hypothetical protein